MISLTLLFSLCLFVVMQLVPRWYEHWTSNLVYDGDMIVLQGQEKIFLSASKESSADVNQQYTKITFTPTQADRFVLAFRTWLRKFGNSQPDWFGSPSQEAVPSTVLSRREVKVFWVTREPLCSFFSSRLHILIYANLFYDLRIFVLFTSLYHVNYLCIDNLFP